MTKTLATTRVIAASVLVAAGFTTSSSTHLAASSAGATKWVAARTPDGHPDFQGVWANNTVTPLQRPKQWEGKERLTDAEVAELQKFAAQIVENDGDAQFGDGLDSRGPGPHRESEVVRSGHRQLQPVLAGRPRLARPADVAHHRSARRQDSGDDARGADSGAPPKIEHRKAHAFEDPEVFPLGERCVNFGIPRLQAGYNSYLQIVQSPGYVTIMNEMAHDARIIPLDGRPHLDRASASGTAIRAATGKATRWSSRPPTSRRRASSWARTRICGSPRKFTRVSPDILNYEFTVNDPTTWTAPWTAMIPLKLKDELIYEYACHEGNEAIPNMLRGHRFEEREAAAAATKRPRSNRTF